MNDDLIPDYMNILGKVDISHPTGIHFELNCVGLRHAIVQIDQYVLNLDT